MFVMLLLLVSQPCTSPKVPSPLLFPFPSPPHNRPFIYLFSIRAIPLYFSLSFFLAAGKTYLLGGKNVTMNEYFNVLQQVSGVAPPLLHPPASVTKAVSTVLYFFQKKIFLFIYFLFSFFHCYFTSLFLILFFLRC